MIMSFKEKRRELVKHLKREKRIVTEEVEKAFIDTPRELFLPDILKKYAYADTPLEIGSGQTISAPHMVAIMCEELDIKKGQKILEIGTGSGYHAAIVSKIVGSKGHVHTIERYTSLFNFASKNLKQAGIKNVTVEEGDGSEGLGKYAPYDRIYITCAAPSPPPPLIEQLKEGGKLLVPVGYTICRLLLIKKEQGKIITKDRGGCAFVPLVGKFGH